MKKPIRRIGSTLRHRTVGLPLCRIGELVRAVLQSAGSMALNAWFAMAGRQGASRMACRLGHERRKSMSDVYGVKRTVVVGSRAAAEMVARKRGGAVVQLYLAGCSLPRQKIEYMYEKDGRCRKATITRTVRHVRARGPFSGGDEWRSNNQWAYPYDRMLLYGCQG